ncbi:Zinc finger, C2H2-type/integrase, DNA-binding protein [Ophiocordyceps camponoti-floridani]|uniref:Zinc finger, C2H2-type/integrase, DNA-binding protein n=1 Tax=Ophiocordyceps camponoti-floridani TaxID=2030778 RepID=A0A8H4VBK7_9HYPO|nr:Zinc finger, C2H2-type/integrase, DNA-binding protein [Ophiocordyceps camponoti-floridani]
MAISPYDGHFQPTTNPFAPSSVSSSSPQPNLLRTNSSSPYLHNGSFQPGFVASPYGAPIDAAGRRLSMGNFISPSSAEYHSGDEAKEKQRCTYPDCGKVFKDLKAHMLTHQNERPEKCPIHTCEYHVKGFARKYDKNRHTLTHYKGTMVCGFCPGSGSPAEKSFNRADVFKRHLTAVHSVEQTPPNSRKKTPTGVAMGPGKKLTGYAPDATGKCSTCSQTFANAQDFYEHLDDCVLRIVQQEDPAEAINAQRLAEVDNDKSVLQTLEKNNLPSKTLATNQQDEDEDEVDDLDMAEDADDADDASSSKANSSPSSRKRTNPPHGVSKSRGLTHSRGGVQLATKTRGRKNRRDYPSSWGFDKGQMTMKKRIMAVFDGSRRLAKDDMMLSTDHEVRLKLSDGKSYVTDLDVQTLKRAEGFHGATEEEKGPWLSDDPTEDQIKEMREMLQTGVTPLP